MVSLFYKRVITSSFVFNPLLCYPGDNFVFKYVRISSVLAFSFLGFFQTVF